MVSLEEKNYRLFELYSSVDLRLDSEVLKRQIDIVKSIMKGYSVSSATRKQLKRDIASLSSIYSAIDRIDTNVLQRDLDAISSRLKKEFENFKLLTGITSVKRKEEKRKKVLTSLEDLAVLNGEVIDDGSEIIGTRTKYNLLELYQAEMTNRLKSSPDFICCKIPLLINAVTPDFIKLPRLGITIDRTSFGTLWNNQWVMAIKKSCLKEKTELEKIMQSTTGEPMSLTYDHAMVSPKFPDYNFYWFLPVKVIVELFSLQVHGFALPFPNSEEKKDTSKADIKSLREARLKREKEKLEKKCHKDTQNQ